MAREHRKQRQSFMSRVFVPTRRTKHLFTRIDELVENGWEDDYCHSLLLLGHSRSGKTHLVTNYIRLRSTEEPDEARRLRILKLEVQAGCTLKVFAADLLIALNDPDPEGGSQAEKTRRVAEAIEREGLDLLIIDEVQRLIDADTDKVKRDVANWITGLLNRRLCPVLLVGEETALRVFENTKHAKGRTFGDEILTPHDWSDEEDRKEFRGVLHLLDGKMEMAELAGLGKTEIAIRVYAFSEGLLGEAARLAKQARIVALRLGRPAITTDILAQAVDELRVGSERKKTNPFRVEAITAPRPAQAEMEPHTPRVRGGRGRAAVEEG